MARLEGELRKILEGADTQKSIVGTTSEPIFAGSEEFGRTLRAETRADGALLTLHYQNGEQALTVKRDGDSFTVDDKAATPETRVVSVGGEIRSSLFAATDAAGLPDSVATQLADMFGGDIDFHRDLRRGDRFTVVYEMHSHNGRDVKSGRVRGLAVTTAKRSPAAPDIPTMQEAGVKGYEHSLWNAVFAPINTPAAIVTKVSEEFGRAVKSPEVLEKFASFGIDAVANSPAQFDQYFRAEVEKWAKVIKATGIHGE